ncbi:DNA methyltransferase [Desulfobacterales bacterium HSG2]|nr:DNA methyltransferase [Desulfobacterales bacterium HSG2]
MNREKFADSRTRDMVSKLARDETGKRQYYRPVYSLHKWWARRPGALFRSLILLATGSTGSLFTTNSGSLSPHSEYFRSHNLEDVVILDPFMGGGTTLAEANRLGAKVVGCDLNPVSFWIVRETLKPTDLEKLAEYFHQLEQTAGEKIRWLYKTECVRCKSRADSLYVFWVRYVRCPHCGENVYLFKRTLLNKGLSRNKPPSPDNPATVFCPECFFLNDWPGEGDCVCQSCESVFSPMTGTYDRGRYVCPRCRGEKTSLIRRLETGEKMGEALLAVEYWCDKCGDRLYKSPDEADFEKLSQIQLTVRECEGDMIIPRQKISEGTSSVRWRKHNYQCYHEVFNARQLLAFNYLIQAIREIPEEEYRNAFITAFSNSLEYNNMMTPYNYPHRKLHHLFNHHAMPLTTTPVENAVWGAGKDGAGTFSNCYRRYLRAKEYCQAPYDKFKDSRGTIRTVRSEDGKISANFASSFEELRRTPRGALLLCGDSSDIPSVPDDSVDFVITDPPYFDSIHYSELSNFFYVWLKSVTDHPCFTSDHVPTEQEAIGNAGMNKGEREYKRLLSSVFRESGRVLKHDGKLVFTFHHTKWRVWWGLLGAITESGFRVADYFPVMSEYKVSPHIRNKQALDMDLVLVCRKRERGDKPLSLSPTEVLERVTDDLLSEGASDNRLFLHFMGQLLKTASSVREREGITYNWFADALSHFDNCLADAERVPGNHI